MHGVPLIPAQAIAVRAGPSVTHGWGCLRTAEDYRWENVELRREREQRDSHPDRCLTSRLVQMTKDFVGPSMMNIIPNSGANTAPLLPGRGGGKVDAPLAPQSLVWRAQ